MFNFLLEIDDVCRFLADFLAHQGQKLPLMSPKFNIGRPS